MPKNLKILMKKEKYSLSFKMTHEQDENLKHQGSQQKETENIIKELFKEVLMYSSFMKKV